MAFVNSINSVVKLDDGSGTPVDVSAKVTDISIGNPVAMLETTTLTQTSNTFIPGLLDGDSVTVTFNYDTTIETQLFAIRALTTSSTLEVAPEGTATGKRRIYGEVWVKDISAPVKVGALVTVSATFQKTGVWTRTVY